MSAIDLTGVHVGGVPPPRAEDEDVAEDIYGRLAERIRDHEDYRLIPLTGPGSFYDFTRERGEFGEHGGGGFFTPAIIGPGPGLIWAPGIARESGILSGLSAYTGHEPADAPQYGYRSRRDDPSREARAANNVVANLGERWIDPLLSRPIF